MFFDNEWLYRKSLIIFRKCLSNEKVKKVEYYHDIRWIYCHKFQRSLSFLFPTRLNEKLIWLSLFWQHPDKVRCADKYKMREYCNEKGLPDSMLVPLLGSYSSAEEINFESLPERFVLKCNHGCGYNIVVDDKSTLDTLVMRLMLNRWLSDIYRGGLSELHYSDISPRIIICEEYLPALDSGSIIDYKIHCVNGIPVFVLVCYDRDEDGVAKLATFDFDWQQLFYCIGESPVEIVRPESLDTMVKYSKVLSADFPFLRADFYDVAGHPYLGEMTFTPLGNMIDYFTDKVQLMYGKMLKLPHRYK